MQLHQFIRGLFAAPAQPIVDLGKDVILYGRKSLQSVELPKLEPKVAVYPHWEHTLGRYRVPEPKLDPFQLFHYFVVSDESRRDSVCSYRIFQGCCDQGGCNKFYVDIKQLYNDLSGRMSFFLHKGDRLIYNGATGKWIEYRSQAVQAEMDLKNGVIRNEDYTIKEINYKSGTHQLTLEIKRIDKSIEFNYVSSWDYGSEYIKSYYESLIKPEPEQKSIFEHFEKVLANEGIKYKGLI